jgi:hypothetical protein
MLFSGAAMMRRGNADRNAIAALVIGAWTATQIASISYGRGHELNHVASRYTDMLAMTVLVNTFFCLRLLRSLRVPAQARTRVLLASIWLTAITSGYALQGAVGFKSMQDFTGSRQMQSENVRTYVLGSNKSILNTALPWNLPYPDKQRLKMMLDNKTIREMLPAGARAPIPLGAFDGGFNANAIPGTVAKPQGPAAYGSFALWQGNDNTAQMSAKGLRSRYPYLLFSVAGDLGREGTALELTTADGTSLRTLAPRWPANESWKEIIVATPTGDFGVQARDESHEHWFAFTPPLEVGRLSAWTHRLLAVSLPLVLICLLVTAFALLFACLMRLYLADNGKSRLNLQAGAAT